MRPPLAARREAARRLAAELRGRLRLPRGGDRPTRASQPAGGEDAAARIDAARDRLRSTVAAPDDPAG